MKTQHTPGPWTIEEGGGNNLRVVEDNPHSSAIICEMPTWYCAKDECDANARLIAESPALLKSLELALKGLEKLATLTGHESDELNAQQARAAIAKATGN